MSRVENRSAQIEAEATLLNEIKYCLAKSCRGIPQDVWDGKFPTGYLHVVGIYAPLATLEPDPTKRQIESIFVLNHQGVMFQAEITGSPVTEEPSAIPYYPHRVIGEATPNHYFSFGSLAQSRLLEHFHDQLVSPTCSVAISEVS